MGGRVGIGVGEREEMEREEDAVDDEFIGGEEVRLGAEGLFANHPELEL